MTLSDRSSCRSFRASFGASRATTRLLPLLLVGLLGGCGGTDDAAPQASAGDVAQAVSDAADASVDTNPLCDLATFAQVTAVIGGNVNKRDVIQDASMPSVDCVYLDTADLYAGLTLRFFTGEALTRTDSQWPTAAAYFAEWGRSGTPVAGLGDAAAWVDMPPGLLVQSGNTALHVSASKLDLADAAVRARVETLARDVVAKLR